MKIEITFEQKDLIEQILNILAVKGLKPVHENAIEFIPVSEDKNLIRVECEAAPLPETCPTCRQAPQSAAPAPLEASVTAPQAPRHYPVEEDDQADTPVTLSTELGESRMPPQEVVSELGPSKPAEDYDDDGEGGFASIRAQSAAIARQKQREQDARRKAQPALMAGETTEPPSSGE